ncbi:MAG: hypothetical protein L0Z53_09525 [Acidobacteriales bacterium]|nr:hypothetical protein [Terriglobales bacterium]
MGLIERLRKAEQGKQAARDAFERAKELGEDAERRMRQKMRIYPPCTAAHHTESKHATPTGAAAAPRRSPVAHPETVQPDNDPIVTIHGEDVDEGEKVA